MAQPKQDRKQLIIQENVPNQLDGGTVRRSSGVCMIVVGILEIIMSVALLFLSDDRYYCVGIPHIVWGIWTGLFVVVAGIFGVLSHRRKLMVAIFVAVGIIAASVSGRCVVLYADLAKCLSQEGPSYDSDNNDSPLPGKYQVELTFSILLCVSFAFQLLMVVIGTGRTFIAVCQTSNRRSQRVIA